MTDPIADMLTRIRNAYMAKKRSVSIPHSKLKHQVALKLEQLGYISDVSVSGEKTQKAISASLVYKGKYPVVTKLIRVSKPGRRVYVTTDKIPTTLSGYGSTILSTSRGVMTDKEAKKNRVGGELLCQIW